MGRNSTYTTLLRYPTLPDYSDLLGYVPDRWLLVFFLLLLGDGPLRRARAMMAGDVPLLVFQYLST